jgi:tRNA nucleotidyltransferase (CCA-adding enzyme)
MEPPAKTDAQAIVLDRSRVPELVLGVLRELHKAGKQAFLAGGSVRDLARLALGQIEAPVGERWPADFDVATDALPEEVLKLFPRAIPTGIQHGTVTVLARAKGEEHKVEVTTFRGEGPYLDGRRPSAVTFLGDIEGDLARRDFTVNAMAWDPLAADLRGLRDPFGGIQDLRRHLLRCVGDAHARFSEDGLRPMRAVRFACTLRLALERKTEQAIGETLETFAKVAKERVHDELEKLLLRGRPPSRGMRLLLRCGLLAAIAPMLADRAQNGRAAFRRMLCALDSAPPVLPVRLAILLSILARPYSADAIQGAPIPRADAIASAVALCAELRFPARTCDRVALLLREQAVVYRDDWTDGDCRRALARLAPAPAALEDFFAFRRALAFADGAHDRDEPMIARWKKLLDASPPLTIQALAIDGIGLMKEFSVLLQLASESLAPQSTGNPQP